MNHPDRLDIRLAMLPAPSGGIGTFVILAPAPLKADMALFGRMPSMSGIVTHGAGMSWPGRTGRRLAETLLGRGQPVAFGFATMADGIACHRRLVQEAAQ